MNTTELLEKLSDYYAQLDLLQMRKAELLDTVLPPEIKQAMDDINAEYAVKESAVRENMAVLEEQVKQTVLEGRKTVRGWNLQAVYCKGRVSWDNAKLEGLMIAFPKLADARKQGEPYMAIKKI